MYDNEKEGKKLSQNILFALKQPEGDSNSQPQHFMSNVLEANKILLQIVQISQRLGGPVDKDLCQGARGPVFYASERWKNEKILKCQKKSVGKW